MKAKVIKIKKGIEPGTVVPVKQNGGNVGHWAEHELKCKGYNVSNAKGVDLPEENVEIKTRKYGSNSAHTIGNITIDGIKTQSWDDSHLKEKCQSQYRIEYNDVDSVITESKIYDFTDPYIQEKFKEAYEAGQKLIIGGNDGLYVRGSKWGYFERKTDNSYEFRIPNAAMKKFKTASSNSKTFNTLFDYVDTTVSEV
jgi:hypothetical protein